MLCGCSAKVLLRLRLHLCGDVGTALKPRIFGSFSVIHGASRIGRDPRSGALLETPATRIPHIKQDKALPEAADLPADEVAPEQSQAKQMSDGKK